MTFAYAGLQKLADPNFFDVTSSSSIQAQLRSASRSSPLASSLTTLHHVAVPLGLLIALGELAVGIATLLGSWSRMAAVGGLLISLGFLLSVSWHSDPYYLGPDIVFCFAWTALLGPPGPWSIDRAVAARSRSDVSYAAASSSPADLRRREFLARGRLAAIAVVPTVLGAGLIAALGRALHGSGGPSTPNLDHAATAESGTSSSADTSSTDVDAPSTSPSTSSPTTASGTAIGSTTAVPVGGAASFTNPTSGDPAFVVQHTSGQFKAFSAVCTHEGCRVEFSRGNDEFVCPCHGAVFDAATGGVRQGPARRPLPAIPVSVRAGQLYVDG